MVELEQDLGLGGDLVLVLSREADLVALDQAVLEV